MCRRGFSAFTFIYILYNLYIRLCRAEPLFFNNCRLFLLFLMFGIVNIVDWIYRNNILQHFNLFFHATVANVIN